MLTWAQQKYTSDERKNIILYRVINAAELANFFTELMCWLAICSRCSGKIHDASSYPRCGDGAAVRIVFIQSLGRLLLHLGQGEEGNISGIVGIPGIDDTVRYSTVILSSFSAVSDV